VDPIHGLAARYCIRQDARGFIELWGLLIALAAAETGVLLSARRMGDRKHRVWTRIWAAVLGCAILLSGAVALILFRWCYESAAASLGVVLPNTPLANLDMKICMTSHAFETINNWITIVVPVIAAVGLAQLAFLRFSGVAGRVLTFAGAAVALLFAAASGGLMLFGLGWCQSSRLF
jgi:hypothetical protein